MHRHSWRISRPLKTAMILIIIGAVIHGRATTTDAHGGKHPAKASPADARFTTMKEMPGKKIVRDAIFADEDGNRIAIGALIDRPTLILPVYYTCPQTCGVMLANLAMALGEMPLEPGIDYRAIALSIDDEDNPAVAADAKKNYIALIKKKFPGAAWKFLTGDRDAIRRFADSIGFIFQKTGKHNFLHPNVLVVISHDGTIIRYLYGPTFLPFDVGMAVTEAAKGTPSLSIRKLVSYCFQYEPEKKTYTFRAVRFIVIGILGVLGIMMFFLLKRKN